MSWYEVGGVMIGSIKRLNKRSALDVSTCIHVCTCIHRTFFAERAGPVVSNFHSANTVKMVMHSAGRPVLICIIRCHAMPCINISGGISRNSTKYCNAGEIVVVINV